MVVEVSPAARCCDQLITIFDQIFIFSHETRLIKGGSEPAYLPATNGERYHRIVFTRDYFASALHEVAHWCIAGAERRRQMDYGYWYTNDGRNREQQQLFEQVEIKPQALEWIFSCAAGFRFRVSADNLSATLDASEIFKQGIYRQVLIYCRDGLPPRATLFAQALAKYYAGGNPLQADRYLMSSL